MWIRSCKPQHNVPCTIELGTFGTVWRTLQWRISIIGPKHAGLSKIAFTKSLRVHRTAAAAAAAGIMHLVVRLCVPHRSIARAHRFYDIRCIAVAISSSSTKQYHDLRAQCAGIMQSDFFHRFSSHASLRKIFVRHMYNILACTLCLQNVCVHTIRTQPFTLRAAKPSTFTERSERLLSKRIPNAVFDHP